MNIHIEGFHGTNSEYVEDILKKGMKPSKGYSHWLGDGSYFFIKGLSSKPENQAEKWAVLQAWDKDTLQNKYNLYTVLKGDIIVEEKYFLDLTQENGTEILNYIQLSCINKLKELGREKQYTDGFLINFGRNHGLADIQVVKANFYIKLTKEDRIFNICRRTQNCTICSVYNPKENVVDLKVYSEGRI